MPGDVADMLYRLSAVLPKRWFSERSPNLNAILRSIATPLAWVYDLIGYASRQTRLSTATGVWLDWIALDYFGSRFGRKADEQDSAYRRRIKAAILRSAATRTAICLILKELTGREPVIFEPACSSDTGAYSTLAGNFPSSSSGLAYGAVGGWGSQNLPMQSFITVTRPPVPGFEALAGYGAGGGGYGIGIIGYGDLSLLPGHVTEQDIQSTLTHLLPVNAIAWLRII